MDSRDWLILKTIDEERSITKTANRLFVSQPSLTYRLNKLEKEFDTILLKRYSNGVSFTSQGEYVLKYAKEMLEQLSEVNKHVQSMNDPISGTIRLGISTVFAKYRLAPILKGYSKRFPNVNVILKTGSSTSKLPEMLESKSVDLIIRRGDMKWSEKKHVILDEPSGIISSKPVNIDKIHLDTWIQDDTSVITEDDKLFYRWWEKKFPSNPPIKVIQVNSIEACIEMVLQGLGWGFLPKIHVQNKKNIYFYPLIWSNGKPIKQQTVMLYRNEVLKEPAIRKFIDYILIEFRKP